MTWSPTDSCALAATSPSTDCCSHTVTASSRGSRSATMTSRCGTVRGALRHLPNEIHVSHSMRTLINKGKYDVSIGDDFDGVIRGCQKADGRYDSEGAWLSEDIIRAYTELHRQNLAQSVEVWEGDRLVGGLYGVTLGRCFIGESMFSLVPSASKLALIFLAEFMQENGGLMIDCQIETPHLKSMGGRTISYKEYMKILQQI